MEKELYKMREIKMPDEMKARILSRCEREVLKEEKFMKNKIRKPITLAVAIAVCISMSVAVVASISKGGFFKDKKDSFGAVTGYVYLNATEEIEVSVTDRIVNASLPSDKRVANNIFEYIKFDDGSKDGSGKQTICDNMSEYIKTNYIYTGSITYNELGLVSKIEFVRK